MKTANRTARRDRRHERIRRKVSGTAVIPRMAICVSNRNMFVQFIDDDRAHTLASASTRGAAGKVNVAAAGELGRQAASAAQEQGIRRVVVDRGGFKYHGRVKAIVEAALQAGLSVSDKPAADQPAPDKEET